MIDSGQYHSGPSPPHPVLAENVQKAHPSTPQLPLLEEQSLASSAAGGGAALPEWLFYLLCRRGEHRKQLIVLLAMF